MLTTRLELGTFRMGGQLYQLNYSVYKILGVTTLEAEKPSTNEKPRNVSKSMLTEPRKYSSYITKNKTIIISSYY